MDRFCINPTLQRGVGYSNISGALALTMGAD
jgi:hypothetical protein